MQSGQISINHLSLNRQIKKKGLADIDVVNFEAAAKNFVWLKHKIEDRIEKSSSEIKVQRISLQNQGIS